MSDSPSETGCIGALMPIVVMVAAFVFFACIVDHITTRLVRIENTLHLQPCQFVNLKRGTECPK